MLKLLYIILSSYIFFFIFLSNDHLADMYPASNALSLPWLGYLPLFGFDKSGTSWSDLFVHSSLVMNCDGLCQNKFVTLLLSWNTGDA